MTTPQPTAGAARTPPATPRRRRRLTPAVRTLIAAVLSNALSLVPVFLLGAMAVLIRRELQFSEVQLGLAAAAFAAASAVGSVPGGRLGERIGAANAMTLGAVGSSLSLLGIAVLARSWSHLAWFLALGGLANAVAQPGTNLALARAIPTARQGLAYGIKQASVPFAILTAGTAVPLIGLTLGWRSAFAGAVLLAVVFRVALPPRPGGPAPPRARRAGSGDAATRPLVVLAVAVAFASAAANAVGLFYVESAVSAGMADGTAGLWFAAGGLVGITARVLWGWLADRREGGHLPVVASLLVAGAGGYGLLALASSGLPIPTAVPLTLGTVLGFGAAWGWPGLFNFAVIRHNRTAPAAATGITQTGVFVGAIIGPPVWGFLIREYSYPVAWVAAGATLLAAAGLMRLGRRSLLRDAARRAG